MGAAVSDSDDVDAATPPRRALLDVRRGFRWLGARVPVEPTLDGGALNVKFTRAQVTAKRERRAVKRLLGDELYSSLRPHHPVTLEVPLTAATFRFPRVLGRSGFVIETADRPEFALFFQDWSDVERHAGRTSRVLIETVRILRRGREARRAREAWRAAIEKELALRGRPRG